MSEQVMRGAKIAMALAALVVLPVSVFGQEVSGRGTSALPGGQATGTTIVKKLSVDDAVQMALEQNLDLQVQRVNPRIQDLNISSARGVWKPLFTSTLFDSNKTSVNTNRYGASGSTVQNDTVTWSFETTQNLRWGGNYDVSWDSNRLTTDDAFFSPNPYLGSTISATYSQALLRNFKIDSYRQQLLVSTKNREISDVQLRQVVLATTRNVKNAYWTLSYYISSLDVQQKSLDLARESLRASEAKVKAGTMAPLDVIQSQAEVASREESVIRAQAYVAQAEDQFRALIMDPQTPNFWDMTFQLTDEPVFKAQAVDVDAAIRNALQARTDLTAQRKNLEANDVTVRYMRNQTLPEVNVQASYSMTAAGGTKRETDANGLPVVTVIPYGSVLRSVLARDLPTWSVALQVRYPIGNSTAEANLARARLQYEQAQTQLRAGELSVATEVRNAARSLMTNQKRVETTRAARDLQERKLQAEEKRLAAGMSTTFFVLQAQRDLVLARNAELSSILDYTRSLVDFETVQQAPTYGGGGGIVIQTGGQQQ